jgi:tetratricopeptide (TPR) repeat protein
MDVSTKELLEEGRKKFAARDFAEAEALLGKVLETEKGYADVHNMLGVIFHDQGKFGKALESFQEALKLNPGYTEACLNLAVTYNDLGMYNEARAVFARARSAERPEGRPEGEIDPFVKGKLANMHADLGEVYAAINEPGAAVDEFKKALTLRPDFADIRTELGKALREAGRKDEALKELQEAKRARPRYAPAAIQLGVTYYSAGRNADALAEWKSVLDYEPDNPRAKMYLRLVSEMSK